MKYTNYKEISGKCNQYLNNTLRECLPKHSSVLVPFGPQAMLLWHQLRCWLPVPCCDKTSGPQATLRKKEFILVDGSRRVVQGHDGEGDEAAGNWEATLPTTQRKQSKGDQLARPPFKFHNAPQTTWKPSIEIPASLGDIARSKHCSTLLFPWVQLVDFIL